MTIIEFVFNKDYDLKNIWRACQVDKFSFGYDFKKTISKKIIQICEGKEFEKCKKDLEKKRIKIHNNQLVPETVKAFNQNWNKIEKDYIKRLEKITKIKFKIKKIKGYLTTIQKCPYNPNKENPYFFVNFFSSLPNALHTAGHETMHIHLNNSPWWEKVTKELGEQKKYDLLEALTKLLDLEFVDLWIVEEKGYPNHQKLREYIKKHWLKNKNFNKLTDDCIKWIKRNGIK